MKAEKAIDEKYEKLKHKYNELLSFLNRKLRILQKTTGRRS